MSVQCSGNVISVVLSWKLKAVRARAQTIWPVNPWWKQVEQDVRVLSHHSSQQPALDVAYERISAHDVGR